MNLRDKDEYNILKARGAVRAPSARCTQLWFSPETREKYHSLLQEVGYDVDNAREHFEFESNDP